MRGDVINLKISRPLDIVGLVGRKLDKLLKSAKANSTFARKCVVIAVSHYPDRAARAQNVLLGGAGDW